MLRATAGRLPVKPKLRLGQIDLIVPNDSVAVRLYVHGTKERFISKQLKRLLPQQVCTLIDLDLVVDERNPESLPRQRLNRPESWIARSHGLTPIQEAA